MFSFIDLTGSLNVAVVFTDTITKSVNYSLSGSSNATLNHTFNSLGLFQVYVSPVGVSYSIFTLVNYTVQVNPGKLLNKNNY
jgi:hypothetical protein